MKQNLLKYGLAIMLAMIASTGLLWADDSIVGTPDTTVTQIQKDSLAATAAKAETDSVETSENKQPALVRLNNELYTTAENLLVYGKEGLLVLLLISFIVDAILVIISFFCLLFSGKDEWYQTMKRFQSSTYAIMFIVIGLIIDSTWFYLIIVAVILYYADKHHLCPELIDGITKIIKILQGKMDISPLSDKEINERFTKEVRNEFTLMAEAAKQQGDEAHIPEMTQKNIIQTNVKNMKTAEDLALEYYRLRRYPKLQKNLRLRISARQRIDLDGLVMGDDENIIIDIKYCDTKYISHIALVNELRRRYSDLQQAVRIISRDTGSITNIIICIVCTDAIMYNIILKRLNPNDLAGVRLELYEESNLRRMIETQENN